MTSFEEMYPEVAQNYRDLISTTGESPESVAARAEGQGAHQLAAWLRQQDAATTGTEPKAPPKGRGTAKKAAAAATGKDQQPPADPQTPQDQQPPAEDGQGEPVKPETEA